MSRISVEDVSFQYEDGTEALKKVSFEIEKGERIAFVGANGSGKSTMALCLNGILRPKHGKIYYDGEPIVYSKKGLKQLRSNVGIVFQDPDHQLFSASVYEEISFGIMNLGVGEQTAKQKVEQIIETLEITPFREKPTHFLSGGQKKQVTIADILVMDPEVVIFDEPVAALDPKHIDIVYNILDQLHNAGITVIVSTHDVNHAYEWADRVVVFCQGNVVRCAPPKEIFCDRVLLEQCSLKMPFIVEIYERLKKKRKNGKTAPSNMQELMKYIEDN